MRKQSSAARVSMGLRPRRLALPVAHAWVESRRWTPKSVAFALSGTQITAKRSSAVSEFMYTASQQRQGSSLLLDDFPRSEEVILDASEFFGSMLMAHDRGPPFTYFTAPLTQLPDQMLTNAPGWEGLAQSATLAESDPRALRPWTQLWAASLGSVTQAHYDVADNVFVQLSGEKEFLLYPPSSVTSLHFFPDAHPRARKSMVNVCAIDRDLHPLAEMAPAPLRVRLSPGDALAIPAFWVHHVTTASSGCISLNIFDESPLKLAASELLSHPLPLHASWDIELRRHGLAVAVRALFDELGLSAAPLLSRLLQSRFAPLERRRGAEACSMAARAKNGQGGGLGDGSGNGSLPSSTPRSISRRTRRGRRASLPQMTIDELRPALDEHARTCGESMSELRAAVHAAAPAYSERWKAFIDERCNWWVDESRTAEQVTLEHYEAVRELTLMHLLELWTVQLFGPGSLANELQHLAERVS